MAGAYSTPLDILNVANTLLGERRGSTYGAQIEGMITGVFLYDKLRMEELAGNLWVFATRTVVLRPIGLDSVVWTPPTWAAGTFAASAIVAYTPTSGPYSGEARIWQTTAAKTSANTTTPDLDPDWHHYTGPLVFDLYNTGLNGTGNTASVIQNSYASGEIALVPATYNAGTTYAVNNVVNSSGSWYVSLVNANVGNTPASSPTQWALWTSVGRAQNLYGVTATNSPIPLSYPAGFSVFLSLQNRNADNPANGTANWLSLGGTITPLDIQWPLNAGPWYEQGTKNVYHLPNGFLKRAPTDPKGGMFSYLGSRSGVTPEDWVIEGKFLTTWDNTMLTLRFVGDVIDVTDMDPLFCGGLGARIAMDSTEGVLQDLAKYNRAVASYNRAITRAKITNSIEVGPISPMENRYVLVRA